jgi:hypothetical protein
MSMVYTVVIQMNDFYEECDSAIGKLNDWLTEHDYNYHGNKFKYLDGSSSAGTKFPECKVIWGGFNYLNEESFIKFFKELDLENSLLTISSPNEGPFTIVHSKYGPGDRP